MKLSRPLIAFAFLAEKFEQTGDIVQGLMPLFSPIIAELEGKEFSGDEFAERLSNYYGIKVHSWAVEDWLSRLESEKYIERLNPSNHTVKYRYLKVPNDTKVDEGDVASLLERFSTFADAKFRDHEIVLSKEDFEKEFCDRLIRMEFLNIVLKPDASKAKGLYSAKTIRLPKSAAEAEELKSRELDEQLDYVCAEFIFKLSQEDEFSFNRLVLITCGALVAEVILDFQVPTKKVEFKNVTIYLDAPFVMDLLDLSFPENVKYSTELFKQLNETGARVAIFPHSIEEIRGAVRAPLERFDRGEVATGPTGSRLRSSPFRAYARSVIGSLEKEIKELGISIAGTSSLKSPHSLQHFTAHEEEELSEGIGHYENASARLRDAGSISNVIRLRQRVDLPMQNLSSCRALFLTRNSRLAERSTRFLISKNVIGERSVPPCVHDRYMAGLLWVVYGGKGVELSRHRLLANCASAISPRQDVIRKMHDFLSALDERKSEHFQALMINDKASHYLMSKALGDERLITQQNFSAVYDEVEKIAAEKVTIEKNAEIEVLHGEYEEKVRSAESRARKAEEAFSVALEKTVDAGAEEIRRAREAAQAAEAEALDLRISAEEARDRADNLYKQVQTLLAEGERTKGIAIEQAVQFARDVQKREQIKVFLWIIGLNFIITFALYFVPFLFNGKPLHAGIIGLIFILANTLLTGIQFWIFPDRFFGAKITRERDTALYRKARELSVENVLDEYVIDWSAGSIKRK